MVSLQLLIVYFLITVSEIMGQTPSSSTSPTCANSNLQMTPSLRQKILDKINDARQTLKNGPVLLANGEYALPAEEMPDLIWNCEKEEQLHQYMKASCDQFPQPMPFSSFPDYSWVPMPPISNYRYDVTDKDAYIETGVNADPTFLLSGAVFLARSPVFTGLQRLDIYHSKAETLACAIYDCQLPSGYSHNTETNFICTVDPKVQFGEDIYEVASSVSNYIRPTQDVICPPNSPFFSIEHREMFMKRINEIRTEIAAGTYVLQNLQPALKALTLNNLVWSCDEENAIGAQLNAISCDNTLYNPDTEFHKIFHPTTQWFMPENIKGYVTQFIEEYFGSNSNPNSNFNFLSTSPNYITPYPAAFALSDQATTFACNAKLCYHSAESHVDFHIVCRANPTVGNNQPLYQI